MTVTAMLRVTFGVLGLCNSVGASEDSVSGLLTLHVHLHDRANVPRKTLSLATQETANILGMAGVHLMWQPGEPDSPEASTVDLSSRNVATDRRRDDRTFVVVRMVRGVPASALPRALGFALPWAQNGVHVTMFYDRIEQLGLAVPSGVAKILGNALAHEIGHVLLASEQHSPNGIMKANWSQADYQHLAVRQLEFLPHQAVRLREEVSRRAQLWELAQIQQFP